MANLRIDVWSDIACPWCYVGKRRLEAALRDFDHRGEVEIVWRAFELDTTAPREPQAPAPYAPKLAAKYRMSVPEAQKRIDHLVATAAADGIPMDFEKIRPGNTFDGHRLIHLGDVHGQQGAVKERFLRAYFSEGRAMNDRATLRELAVEVGLPAAEVDEVLAGDRFAAEVREDEAQARQLGIRGVPFFVLDRRLGVSGAQPVEVLRSALAEAWKTRAEATVEVAEGAACGPDGCV